jgi:hypothetical protein
VFVLRRSGCVGRLSSGRIERTDSSGLRVYNTHGLLNEYISGDNLRSWCVLDFTGRLVEGWSDVQPEDRPKIIS